MYLVINIYGAKNKTTLGKALFYKKELVSYIKDITVQNKYPCISVNYIADFGSGVGFRYLFWYNKIKVVKPDSQIANIDIVIPGSTSGSELNANFGSLGVINPKVKNKLSAEKCDLKSQELEPLLGYVD